MKNTSVSALLDLNHTIARALFEGKEHPWEVLPGLSDWIRAKGAALPADEYSVYIAYRTDGHDILADTGRKVRVGA